jgi:hypothetical protein
MARTLRISLINPRPELVHQWRNFGEDVYGELRDACEVSISEIDASTSEFHVRKIHTRELRKVTAQGIKIAEKNLMAHIVNVCEVAEDA